MTDTSKPPYPPDWKEISLAIRARSGGRCECVGECGLHKTGRMPLRCYRCGGYVTERTGIGWECSACGYTRREGRKRCTERNGALAMWAKGKVMLTVAHLNHHPADCRPENLKAMCQRCHLRYDQPQHMRNAHLTRDRKSGQRRFEL